MEIHIFGITVISSTWRATCPEVSVSNDTASLAQERDGFDAGCEHLVKTAAPPDPAPGSSRKAYLAARRCGNNPTPRRTRAETHPHYGRGDLIVEVECDE